MIENDCGLILALDVLTLDDARSFLDKLAKATPYVKIGPRLYALGGIKFAKEIIDMGYNLFLDLKLHDIPNTVASAVQPLSEIGLWALTIHTSGGYEMMARSVAMRNKTESDMKLFGITVLTSLDGKLWSDVHPGSEIQQALILRAETAERAGLDGIVCSPLDLELLKGRATNLMRIVPGIRAAKVSTEDQARVATAEEAAKAGASYIVVGRPILESADPILATQNIINKLLKVKR
ncbi:MAG: orotidine-5'-phosphate decarboxylase [Synergistaceae bacterium]|nr:orotidine-5'-phosphate decarboxylase [Synergistaceae bacterium]